MSSQKVATSAEQRSLAARERLLAELPVTERRFDLAGVSTAVFEGGSGAPLVLLHGPGEYAAKWLRVIPDLVKGYRVVAPDLPGHGTSAVRDGPPDRDRVLAWLRELIERTCPTPPVLVGQIMGGSIAARFAAAPASAIERLVLVDALGLAPFEPAPAFGEALTDFVTQRTEETHDRLWRQCAFDLDALRDGMGPRWDHLRAYNLDRALATSLLPTQQVLFEQFALPAIPPEVLANIRVPTTLIWGRHDLATPLRVAQAASERYGWPLHIIERAADDPPLEQPQAFLRALRIALDDVSVNATSQ